MTKLIHRSNNLVLKNNFGKTVIDLAKSMYNPNKEFIEEEMKKAIERKMKHLALVMSMVMDKTGHKMNQYVLREIYKYIDG